MADKINVSYLLCLHVLIHLISSSIIKNICMNFHYGRRLFPMTSVAYDSTILFLRLLLLLCY